MLQSGCAAVQILCWNFCGLTNYKAITLKLSVPGILSEILILRQLTIELVGSGPAPQRIHLDWGTRVRASLVTSCLKFGRAVEPALLGRLGLKRWQDPSSPCDANLLGSLSTSGSAFKCGKRDPPKAIRGIIPFNKFDSVNGNSLRSSQLRDYPSGYLSATRVAYHDSGANQQLTR